MANLKTIYDDWQGFDGKEEWEDCVICIICCGQKIYVDSQNEPVECPSCHKWYKLVATVKVLKPKIF